jgi:hypothetical protein
MKILISTIFILIFALTAFSQEYEYGKTSELKGLTKIYINTGTDGQSHDRLVEYIEKVNITGLKIVDSANEAEISIILQTDKIRGGYGMVEHGKGYVAVKGSDLKKARILINFEAVRTSYGGRPVEKIAKQFIKAYKEANEIK